MFQPILLFEKVIKVEALIQVFANVPVADGLRRLFLLLLIVVAVCLHLSARAARLLRSLPSQDLVFSAELVDHHPQLFLLKALPRLRHVLQPLDGGLFRLRD